VTDGVAKTDRGVTSSAVGVGLAPEQPRRERAGRGRRRGRHAAPRRTGRIAALAGGSLLPASSIGRRLAAISVIDAVGTGMFLTGSALYFVRVIGLTDAQVGLGLALAGVFGLLAAIPIGVLADRLRAGRVYIGLQTWRGLCYAAYAFVGSLSWFIVVACCIGLADTAVPAITQAVVGAAVPADERVDTMAKVRAVRNIGFGAGALVAAGIIQQGSNAAFAVIVSGNAVSFFVAAVLLQRAGVARLATAGTAIAHRRGFGGDARYLGAALANGVLCMHLTLLSLGLPLWIAQRTDVPAVVIGITVALNTLLTVALQARFARPAATIRGATWCAVLAGLSLAGFGVLCEAMRLASLPAVGVLVALAAVTLLTFGELWQSASGWTIAYDLARPDRRAQYLATFQLGQAMQAIAGPLVVTKLLVPTALGWYVFGGVAVLAGLAIRGLVAGAVVPATNPA